MGLFEDILAIPGKIIKIPLSIAEEIFDELLDDDDDDD